MGVSLPAGTRIRFANPTWPAQWKFRPGLPPDTRLFEVFEPGSKRFFAWDAHVTPPGSAKPHPFYHVNQRGMHALFGASDISPIAAADLPAARGLRYARIGGRPPRKPGQARCLAASWAARSAGSPGTSVRTGSPT
jgi:hypothetical protein